MLPGFRTDVPNHGAFKSCPGINQFNYLEPNVGEGGNLRNLIQTVRCLFTTFLSLFEEWRRGYISMCIVHEFFLQNIAPIPSIVARSLTRGDTVTARFSIGLSIIFASVKAVADGQFRAI